ncbi:hypothetical protein AB6A40_007611 [Gnathostoma spinigerum]|uniref:Glycine N-acyltransferase-like protein n=1 Tax=Gnathostoma spinigerum TaxID=75299 RepID=A0ABD6EWE9_9BILA
MRSFETLPELREALALTSDSVYLLPIHVCLKHEIAGVYPEAKCVAYGYPSSCPQLWMLIRRNKFTRAHVFMGSRTYEFLTEAAIDEFLFLALPHLIDLSEFSTRILGVQLTNRMSEILSSHFDFSAPSLLGNYFLINVDKQREIAALSIELPDGYEFFELDPEKDSLPIAESWKFSSPGERDQFAAKIRSFPSVGIRTTVGGELASFIVLDSSSFFNHQYTYPEHRQRGLASAAELRLAQKVIKRGLHPMKFVEQENTAVSLRSLKSPWWSTVVDETGVPLLNDHRVVYRLSSFAPNLSPISPTG